MVMQKIAEQLVARGHHVTVATSYTPERTNAIHNGVVIKDFKIQGNRALGFNGDLKAYTDFVLNFKCDAILVKAAQQWTFDALWPVLDNLSVRKIFIPCGFSGLADSRYVKYFEELRPILFKWDHLIFYSDTYQDIQFVRNTGYDKITVLPNGACASEFGAQVNAEFSKALGIKAEDIVLLSVSTLSPMKGQLELVESFRDLNTNGREVVLILNAKGAEYIAPVQEEKINEVSLLTGLVTRAFSKLKKLRVVVRRGREHLRRGGYASTFSKVCAYVGSRRRPTYLQMVELSIKRTQRDPHKKILFVDLARADLVQAYFRADLFVFTSKLECSPLVLYESAASGTPFISTRVGNADEIAAWTRGGEIMPGCIVENGATTFDRKMLANILEGFISEPTKQRGRGLEARQRWKKYFTWDQIATHYEEILASENCTVENFR